MVWLLAINAQEISALIKKQIENFQPNFDETEKEPETQAAEIQSQETVAEEKSE